MDTIERDRRAMEESWLRDEEHEHTLERRRYAPTDQQLGALQIGNHVRIKRAGLKKDVKAGRAGVVEVLARPPWWVHTMMARDLLLAVPQWGSVKVAKVLSSSGVGPHVTVGRLTDRQRQALIAEAVR